MSLEVLRLLHETFLLISLRHAVIRREKQKEKSGANSFG